MPPARRRSQRRVVPQAPTAPRGAAPRPAATAAAPAADPLVGKVFGRCRLQERIGQGRTAVVYRAHHEALDATVAVKVLRPAVARNSEIAEKFETEARAIAKIDNENVLKIYDVGSENGLPYIVMELLQGESVLEILARERRIEPMDALRITRQAASGLAAAHARNLIHRDVKPQNMVLLEDGTVKLVDFGLAVGDEAGSQRVGTPHYMAPEVCESGQAVTKSDIYALGISLYHMLVGSPPYAGQDIPSILRSHVKGDPLRPERHVPKLPPEVADLVRTLTKRDALTRPGPAELIEMLDRIGGKEVKAKDTLRARRRRRRTRAGLSPAAVVALVVLGLGGFAALLFVTSGGGKKGDGREERVDPATTPPLVIRPPSTTPATPPPDPAAIARAERERKDQEEKQRNADAIQALLGVEKWIRENWRGPSDTEAILGRYRTMRDAWKDTPAAKEADQRIRDIRAGTRHPHPDKSWSDPEVVSQALAAWRGIQGDVERMISEHRYLEAKVAMPPPVEDPTGKLGKDLASWHALVDRLVAFKTAFGEADEKVPAGRRGVTTPDGPATLLQAGEKDLIVEKDGVKKVIPWTSVPASELHRIARDAFEGRETVHQVELAAHAFAHRLRDEFFDAVLNVELAQDGRDFAPLLDSWKAQVDERMRQPAPEKQD